MSILTPKGNVTIPSVDLKQFGVVESRHLTRKGKNKKMPDSEAKTRWQKENMLLIGLKLHRVKDADIIEYLNAQGKDKQKAIKKAIRAYMAPTEAQPAEGKKPTVDYSWFFEDEDENEQ